LLLATISVVAARGLLWIVAMAKKKKHKSRSPLKRLIKSPMFSEQKEKRRDRYDRKQQRRKDPYDQENGD
jgi:hypothetical protein